MVPILLESMYRSNFCIFVIFQNTVKVQCFPKTIFLSRPSQYKKTIKEKPLNNKLKWQLSHNVPQHPFNNKGTVWDTYILFFKLENYFQKIPQQRNDALENTCFASLPRLKVDKCMLNIKLLPAVC